MINKISATKLTKTLVDKKTRSTITFTKKNGEKRVMDCIPQNSDELGYINVKELPTGKDKKVDARKLISAKCGNTEYIVQ